MNAPKQVQMTQRIFAVSPLDQASTGRRGLAVLVQDSWIFEFLVSGHERKLGRPRRL